MKSESMFKIVVISVFALGLLFVVPAQGGAVKPIKIGCVTSLTGPNSGWGIPTATVYQWVVGQVNKEGGIKSLGGAKIELIISDCESDPQKVVTEVEKMIALHHPNVMLSAVSSQLTKASLPIIQRRRIPMVGMEYGDELFEMGNPFWFSIASKASLMGKQMADFILKTGEETGHPATAAALLFQDGAMGEALYDALLKYLPAKGIKVVAHDIYPTGKVADFSDTFAKYKSLGANVAFFGCPPHDAVLINKGMRAADFNPLGFAFCGQIIGTPDYQNLGKYADHSFGTPVISEEALGKIKGARNSMEMFYSEEGKRAKIVSKAFFLQLTMVMGAVIHGLEKAGSYDPLVIRDAIKELDLKTGDRFIYWPDGLKFDAAGWNTRSKWIGGQLQNMTMKVLYPESIVSSGDKPSWPIPKWGER